MANNNTGVLSFLNENAIQNKPCDLTKPFAFVSYSHAPHDACIVQNTFGVLHLMGFNLWIDVANIPFDQYSWQRAAFEALHSDNCKAVIFFRSENSMTKAAVADEVDIFSKKEGTRVVTVDMWTNPKSTAQSVYHALQLDSEKAPQDEALQSSFSSCKRICEGVDYNNSALRLAVECQNDIGILTEKIAEQLVKADIYHAEPENNSEKQRKSYVETANVEIERNAKVFRDNDFGLLAENLRNILPALGEVEVLYKDLGKKIEKNKGLRRRILFRRDVIFRIALVLFVTLAIVGVLFSTLYDTAYYDFIVKHVDSLQKFTDLFPQPKNPDTKLFVNILLAAIFDTAVITLLVTLLPAIVKVVLIVVNAIKISGLKKEGEAKIKETIPKISNFPYIYMCSFAVEFFIRTYSAREAKDVKEAMALFDAYKTSEQGLVEVAKIAPWLHYLRKSFEKVW